MVNYVIDLTGLIISILGMVQVLRNRILEKQSRRYFLALFCTLIAYAVSDLISWMTYGIPGGSWLLTSKVCLFLESVFSCSLIPLLSSFLLYSSGGRDRRRTWILQIIRILFAVYLILLVYTQFSTAIYYYDEQNIYHRGPWYSVLLVLPALMSVLNLWLLWTVRARLPRPQIIMFASCFLIPALSMVIQMLFYGISVIVLGSSVGAFVMLTYVMNSQTEQYFRQQAENSKLKTEILLSQIQPHFLFNTLGTISHLCADAPEAKKAIVLFSRYLRGNIEVLSDEMLIPFEKETEHAGVYLELEKLRFGDSLQVSWDLACTDFLIPSLTLQPLVENAVRYGVRGNPDGCGTVRIRSRDCGDHYEISVLDDGPGFLPEKPREPDDRFHIGIENVRERLRLICGGELQIASGPGRGTQITIILPKDTMPAARGTAEIRNPTAKSLPQ